tara:strand:- start:2812 stop:3549 length:738 start_codon:yes stop_codon:yes gene_type:complete
MTSEPVSGGDATGSDDSAHPDAPHGRIVLGSRSPRRRELLTGLPGFGDEGEPGVRYEVEVLPPSTSDEPGFADCCDLESIRLRLSQIARMKAEDVRLQLGAQRRATGIAAVVTADTVIIVEDAAGRRLVLGQPTGDGWREQVRGWFADHLLGRTHLAATAVCLVSGSGRVLERVVESCVTMSGADGAWVDSYLDSHESLGKAGGYAIQGRAGELVTSVDGSRTNVIGLPVEDVTEMLGELGIDAG